MLLHSHSNGIIDFYQKTSDELTVGPGTIDFFGSDTTLSLGETGKADVGPAKRPVTKERLWANLKEGRSGILGSGIPFDWSILTGYVNTRALLSQMKIAIWRSS